MRGKYLCLLAVLAVERATQEKRAVEAAALRTVRVVAIDTVTPRMFHPVGQYVLKMTPARSPSELRTALDRFLQVAGVRSVVWTHHVRYWRTLEILRTEFPELPPDLNYAMYRYVPGDVLIAAVLKRRPPRSNPCAPMSPDDLAYWLVVVEPPIKTPADLIPKL